MSVEQKHKFTLEEVTSPQSRHLVGMNRWLELIFPEYCPPRFNALLSKLRKHDGRHEIQIFISLAGSQVVGLIQLFYRKWQGGLIADIDLLGVLVPFRRSGLATALFQHSLLATPQMAHQYQIPMIGMVSLIDPKYTPIQRLHQKHEGQIRTDYQYPSGDKIVWYPMQPGYEDISTLVLGEQLQQFGLLLDV